MAITVDRDKCIGCEACVVGGNDECIRRGSLHARVVDIDALKACVAVRGVDGHGDILIGPGLGVVRADGRRASVMDHEARVRECDGVVACFIRSF